MSCIYPCFSGRGVAVESALYSNYSGKSRCLWKYLCSAVRRVEPVMPIRLPSISLTYMAGREEKNDQGSSELKHGRGRERYNSIEEKNKREHKKQHKRQVNKYVRFPSDSGL